MRLPFRPRPLAAAMLLLASAAFGCANSSQSEGGIPRVAVSGQVTLDGKPLPAGTIELTPIQSDVADVAVGQIQDGRYSIIRAVGPSPGKYKVRVSSRKPVMIAAGQEPAGGRNRREPETVPTQFNSQTKLEVDVPAEASASLDFTLNSKS